MTQRRHLSLLRSLPFRRAWFAAGLLLLNMLPLVFATSAAAQGRLDVPAQAKIEEAINVHYLATDFVKAEQVLAGTINACGNQCSPAIIAKAWMYIGIVRGAGGGDMNGAKEAFRNAFVVYPAVTLDNDLATQEVQAAFAEVQASAPSGVALTPAAPAAPMAPAAPAVPAAPPPAPVVAPMQCDPKVQEAQTRRAIPLSCVSQTPGVMRATVFFREFGAAAFSRAPMKLQDGAWVGEIPCTATGMSGTLSWYVEAGDAKGNRLDGYGTAAGPVDILLAENSEAEPPHLPGKPAPDRCADLAECPAEMRGTPACPGTEVVGGAAGTGSGGTKGWGDSCEEHTECQAGLACLEGTCESAPFCSTDLDCSGGYCDKVAGTCAYGGDAGSSTVEGPTNMVGISIAVDLAFVSGSGICDPNENKDFACFFNDKPYLLADPLEYNEPQAMGALIKAYGGNGQIGGAFAIGSIRLLASYERMLTPNISVGADAGLAFSPIPGSGSAIHVDGHGKYWFTGNGNGLRVFASAGLGFGQVDVSTSVAVLETQYQDTGYWLAKVGPDGKRPDTVAFGAPANGTFYGTQTCQNVPNPIAIKYETCQYNVDATTSFGTTFLALGVGAWYNMGGHGPQLELLGKVLFPATGLSLQPTLSYLLGF